MMDEEIYSRLWSIAGVISLESKERKEKYQLHRSLVDWLKGCRSNVMVVKIDGR
jgi:carbamoylphosphate synthase small subunit